MNNRQSDKLFAKVQHISRSTSKMKIYVILAACIFLALANLNSVLSLLAGSVLFRNTGTIIQISPLHIEGPYVKNSQNQTVFLRGVNRPSGFTLSCTGAWFQNGDWLYGYGYTHWDETGLRQRLQQMRDSGFNVIRLTIFAEWWVKNSTINLQGQQTDKNFQFCYSETVRIAQEYGIYIVIAPWASDQSSLPTPLPFPTTTIPNQTAFVSFWVDVSDKLEKYPNVIYELYNEPAGDMNTWFNAVNTTVQAIRQNNDDHIIIVQYGYGGGFGWINDPRIQGTNILYSNHIYRYPAGATIPGTTAYSTYDAINSTLQNTWNYTAALNSGKALWIGEIGASAALSESSTGETSYWRNALQLLDDWKIGYAAWNWDQPGSGWDLQNITASAPYLPNERGQILINAIANGRA